LRTNRRQRIVIHAQPTPQPTPEPTHHHEHPQRDGRHRAPEPAGYARLEHRLPPWPIPGPRTLGGLLASQSFPATAAGYEQMLAWAGTFGTVRQAGVGMHRFLRRGADPILS
jgi:hypothetical protein